MNNVKRIIWAILLIFIPLMLAACSNQEGADTEAVNIEIRCQCEDVYRIFYSSYIAGQYYGMGAAADIDGRMLASDVVLKVALTRSYFEDSDISLLSMDFSPYGQNDSYEMGTTNQVKIRAEYGETYRILIEGSKESGFTAALES